MQLTLLATCLPAGRLITNVNSVETIMCIASFCIGNNYRDLAAASLCVRLLQTHLLFRSPPCSLEQRSIQPVWWWRLLCFSHREDCSHHKGSFAGHTHGVLCKLGLTNSSSANCKAGHWFELDKHCSTLVFNFIIIFSISSGPGRRNSNPQPA